MRGRGSNSLPGDPSIPASHNTGTDLLKYTPSPSAAEASAWRLCLLLESELQGGDKVMWSGPRAEQGERQKAGKNSL